MALSVLRLGTRRSLLAWAQSGWVARELERLNPGLRVELVGIETRGDRIQDVPLSGVEGKEFFVAELDDALRAGRVDLTVHSMKDLSLERPKEFALAAIPARENPRDAVIFGPGVEAKLRAGETLRIGTSSPRRLENVPGFLRQALPSFGASPQVELVEMRGNVNTRLSRVHEPAGSDRRLDGVVLALAGLARLWSDGPGRAELERLLKGVRLKGVRLKGVRLKGVRWMILPLRECPAAPAQGALAVECRAREEDAPVRQALAKLHDAATARDVALERALLAESGGGCHQRFGATAVTLPALGTAMFVRGALPDGAQLDEIRWEWPARSSHHAKPWDGTQWRAASESEFIDDLTGVSGAVFVAHSRAVPESAVERLAGARVWASGTPSWFRLARQGVFVEGCTEGLGFEACRALLTLGVLGLPPLKEWTALTHTGGVPAWQDPAGPRPRATYKVREGTYPEEARQALAQATHVYWSSGSQFDELKALVPVDAIAACGPGRTAERLKAAGVAASVFPSVEEWKKWIRR